MSGNARGRPNRDTQAVGRTLLKLLSAGLLCGASQSALAQSATPGTVIELSPILVEGWEDVDSSAILRARFDAIAGGVALVDSSEMPSTANLTMSRALRNVPGVVVQDFFGGNDQPRIQIRGSGLQQNPVERGILMLQNGLPLNRADGSYIVGFANPAQAQSLEVYRGYTANRLGATVLGGALNLVSPTGRTGQGVHTSISGGSFGQFTASAGAGYSGENYDVFAYGDHTQRDGFRVYNESERTSVGLNAGFAISENVQTRIFAGYTDLGFDVAGPLPKDLMEQNPKQVHAGPQPTGLPAPNNMKYPGPNVIRDQPRRDADQFLIGSRTTAQFDAHKFDFVLGYTYTDDTFRFPIGSGIRTTEGGDVTTVARYAWQPDETRPLPLFEASVQYSYGTADRGNYLNIGGTQGAMFGDSDLEASTLSLYAGAHVPVSDRVTISPAISYSRATRENEDKYTLPNRPTFMFTPGGPVPGTFPTVDTSYDRTYDGWTPSLGLTWEATSDITVFGAVSRSFEPPTHDDLIAPIQGSPNGSPGTNPGTSPPAMFATPDLDAQTATTIEGGARGTFGKLWWDTVVYYSWVENELLSLRDTAGNSLGAVNADDTTHFGIELGLGAQITERLYGRLAYTFQDFRFDDDPMRGDNYLAGAPRHVISALLNFDVNEDWTLQGAMRWNPTETPVDNMNTLFADSYVVFDVRTEYRITDSITAFGEITNLFDENYASSTLVVDQARPDQAAFLPGDGRGFFAGLKSKF